MLGTPYDLEITAAGGHIRVSYNGTQKADVTNSGSGWYFKTGSYVQSNPSRGDAPDATGQVVLYSLDVQHALDPKRQGSGRGRTDRPTITVPTSGLHRG